nr:hypothetical protein CFP56_53235 [Quercus suber]
MRARSHCMQRERLSTQAQISGFWDLECGLYQCFGTASCTVVRWRRSSWPSGASRTLGFEDCLREHEESGHQPKVSGRSGLDRMAKCPTEHWSGTGAPKSAYVLAQEGNDPHGRH